MSSPPPAHRVNDAADALRKLPVVASTDVYSHDPDDWTYGDPHVSVVIREGIQRVPPAVLETLSDHDLGIADVTPQGDHLILAAI